MDSLCWEGPAPGADGGQPSRGAVGQERLGKVFGRQIGQPSSCASGLALLPARGEPYEVWGAHSPPPGTLGSPLSHTLT